MANNLLDVLRKLNKDYYSISELERISKLRKGSLLVKLTRMEKQGEIKRLMKGYYQIPNKFIDLEKVITQIYPETYISFESALSIWGVLSQKPFTITLATTKKPKKITFLERQIEFRRIKESLFFGFDLINGLYLAKPEKALLDQLYLVTLGKASLNLEELDLKSIDKKLLSVWVKKYPLRTQKIVNNLL